MFDASKRERGSNKKARKQTQLTKEETVTVFMLANEKEIERGKVLKQANLIL
jgi:hypothetical protein